ncbi:uncharacterized protein LOC116298543 [Actinia tenebrosa]|uniref:Uncharacterized protein LOC116298543 n=1 Tax=Actinia tenebrosa TaxID=6105 RepID=A0A6P8ICS9_ACTTE|nr:uncharacterized protein LOC116298543 [Actinia tenebrosa]
MYHFLATLKRIASSLQVFTMETHILMLVAIFGVLSYSQAFLPHTQCKRTYEKVGGFIEKGDRTLTELLLNDRDINSDENDGHILDWNAFEASIHSLACRCAAKAKEKGYKVFGLQFFGECWSGPTAEANYAKYGAAEASKSYQFTGNPPPPCDKSKEQECVGGPMVNYVYRLKDEQQSVDVDGGYSKWSDWTACSKTCGGGVKGRERTCTNPAPEGKGKDCSQLGPAEETASCAEKACPVPAVDGNWSPWKLWTACSATCGGGVRVRERLCNNPAPQGAGKKCVGSAEQSEACADEACPIPCVKALDIGIILDASGSVRAHNFKIALDFIQDLIKHFQVSPKGTHFGFIIYSGKAKVEFKMSDSRYHNFNSIMDRIRSIRYTGGWTRTDRALEMAATQLFTPAGGDRKDKDNILIVFTDGKTNRGSKPYPQVLRPLQAKHVRNVAVGIGSGINFDELRQIAMGDPHYVVKVDRFSDLKNKLQVILDDSCQGISPPTPEPECTVHGKALGMESRVIPDSSLSATSEWDANHGAARGRLNLKAGGGKTGAWSARYNDKGQYLQVDFGKAVKITRVASQGRQDHNQWITSYWLSYSQDDGLYDAYTPIARKGKQIFVGNKDRNTVVEHKLEVPIFARYLRVHPETFRGHISGRFEFYGCTKGFSPPVIPTCMSALGLQCGKIPDSKITASSEFNSGHRAANARLYFQSGKGRTGAWSAKSNNIHQWLQVDFGKVAKIQKVATQGRQEANQWVTSFYLSYSREGIFFEKTKVYGANSDRNSVVVTSINPPIYARYVRIHPVAFYGHISLRAEFYGCTSGFVPPAPRCVAPLGMQGRSIPDSRITASSMWNANHSPSRARLGTVKQGAKRGAWSAKSNDAGQWLQIAFGKAVKITRVATQGRQDYNQWVKTFSLQYSQDGSHFENYEGGKVLTGNADRNTIVGHVLLTPIIARYIRVRPKSWYRHISMRLELYGCTTGFPVPPTPACLKPLGVQSKKISDSQMSASSELNAYYGAKYGRLHLQKSGRIAGSWTALRNNRHQWLGVDFGKVAKVTRVSTQGSHGYRQWVTSYALEYSLDGADFKTYRIAGKQKIFAANRDQHTVVSNSLPAAIYARYVRLRPLTWYRRISMRVEVYGCTSGPDFKPPPVPKCTSPLGLQNHLVKDAQMSASSEWSRTHRAGYARLYGSGHRSKAGSWSSRVNNADQWLQIDFLKNVKVTGVATQGREDYNQWIKDYSLSYSREGIFWHKYEQGGKVWLFKGNNDRYTVVRHQLETPFVARYVRILPKRYHGHISMRAEIFGCREGFTVPPVLCASALGMQSRAIPDSRITVSSKWDSNHGPDRARLGATRSGRKIGAWSAKSNDAGQWIQVDLGKVTKVTRIATQGRSDYSQWVKTYLLQYSTNGVQFSNYGLLTGNKDRNTISGHLLDPPVIARYIRVLPKTWYAHISMRLEVYGCTHAIQPTHPPCLQPLSMKDDQMSASTIWHSSHRAANGRLNFHAGRGRTGAWSARRNSANQWLQVDFGRMVEIRRIETQGRQDANQWVKTYTVLYSNDGQFWRAYSAGGRTKVFSGNFDRYTVVGHNFEPAIVTRYIRVNPTAWHGHISMRLQYYGCTSNKVVPQETCRVPLGIQKRTIPDSSITASSMWNANHSPSRARLGIVRQGAKTGAWSARTNDVNQWIQVDMGRVVKVTRIATQGRQDYNQWVKTYAVQYSMDGGHFEDYQGGRVLTGNSDRNSIVGHSLEPAIIARYIRIRPKSWYGHISMRFEIYGCTSGFPVPTSPACGYALGLQSHGLRDSQMRASSEWNSGHRAANGRLHFRAGGGRTGAWSAKYNNAEQWLQVDFGKIAKIIKIATQGRQDANQWVKSYTLSYSRDGVFWNMLPEVLRGNSDRSTVVSHNLKRVIYARYLRIHPRSWQGHISMRAEVYGCTSGFQVPTESCLSALGMQRKTIPDSSIKASSTFDANHSPSRARLGTVRQGAKRGAWSAKTNDAGQWIQVDIGRVVKVTRIATQGRQDYNQWVKTYTVQYSMDGGHFEDYQGGRVLKGNSDRNSIVGHILEPAIIARYIRIRPKSWYGHVSMRFEIYGCTSGFPIPPTPSCAGAINLGDWMLSSSSDWNYNHRAANGKLDFVAGGGRTGAWSARHNNANQWLLVDFDREMKITRISTQGRQDANQWVRTYTVEYSQDGVRFTPYSVGKVAKIFAANTDRHSVVSHKLPTPIVAQYVRLRPKSWYSHISMRVGMYGCPTGKKPASPPCHQAMDVGVIMDRSGSIGAENFRKSQDFVASLISHFEYASSGTRFGVIAYNAAANTIFRFNDAAVQNSKTLMNRVYGIKYLQGGTRTDRALQLANSDLYSSRGGYRSNVPNVLFVLTDGKTNRGSLPYSTVLKPLLAKKVKMIAVGVGKGINDSELRQISRKHVFHVKDFNALSEKLKDILDASCP